MSSIYPSNLVAYIFNHDPSKIDYRKSSYIYQEKKRQGLLKEEQNYNLNESSTTDESYEPDFVRLDKQVLRFFGYFKESCVENELENARIRLLVIYYYLLDGEISINEVKQVNSGIPQGLFLKKTKVFKDDGITPLTFQDFQVGEDITIFSKVIRIYDADQYTRDFCAMNGKRLSAVQPIPLDSFTLNLLNKPKGQKDHAMKDYLEYSMGGGKPKNAKQFLENDRKVLRYFATFEGLKYIIHYYLSDDTVEIMEVNYNNSGRDAFPLFLRRSKLPRKFAIAQPGEDCFSDFYKDSDIEPFMTLWAFNRPFKILGCDEFTSDYYLTNYRRNFPVGGFEDPPQKDQGKIIIPPYNGFGSEEDSLGNCLKLINKPPKKDYYKYINNDKIILRYLARLNTKVLEDLDRRFLISFFLNDDSIQVYEMNNRNSGIWEGKFLERGMYKNVENDNKKFNVSDFEVGKSMVINKFSFYLIDCDEYTKKWMANNLK